MVFEEERAIVQDDRRQRQLAEICGLKLSSKRGGPDAYDEWDNPYELKSTTKTSVTTARDVGIHTLQHWRAMYWIIAQGIAYKSAADQNRFKIERLYIAHPDDLETFFASIEQRLKEDLDRCEKILAVAEYQGLDPKEIDFCRGVIRRGITLNNPKILMELVSQSTLLDHSNSQAAIQQVRKFVQERPLPPSLPNPLLPPRRRPRRQPKTSI